MQDYSAYNSQRWQLFPCLQIYYYFVSSNLTLASSWKTRGNISAISSSRRMPLVLRIVSEEKIRCEFIRPSIPVSNAFKRSCPFANHSRRKRLKISFRRQQSSVFRLSFTNCFMHSNRCIWKSWKHQQHSYYNNDKAAPLRSYPPFIFLNISCCPIPFFYRSFAVWTIPSGTVEMGHEEKSRSHCC